ncbi:hypothetical protein [Rheinheimera nanhaiensis]|nr:hypothetical protein [Rheinheimera nanhaiensis]
MMLVTKWVHVPEKAINKPRQIEQDGVKFTQSISPWDLPQQFRFLIDAESLTIEWRYLSDSEPVKRKEFPDGFAVELGKTSSRIYKITVSLSALEKSISVMPTDEAEAATSALIKMKNALAEIENYPNENNKVAMTKTAHWWANLPNKAELLANAM